MARPRLTGIAPIPVYNIGDENTRRMAWNFARILQWAQDVERLWVPEAINFSLGLPSLWGSGDLGDVVISSNTNFDSHDIREYRNLTIDSGVTLGVSGSTLQVLILIAQQRITVNGTIDVSDKGGAGGATSGGDATDYAGSYGASGGGGGGGTGTTGGDGGDTIESGGAGGSAGNDGSNGSALTNINLADFRMLPTIREAILDSWGAGGGGGGNTSGGVGGNGGGVVILIAPQIVINGTVNVSGEDGTISGGGPHGGGGGGGGGLVYAISKSFINDGTVNVSGGTGGVAGANGDGGNGGAGQLVSEIIGVS